MQKQLLLINQEKIEESYNQERLDELINYYNSIIDTIQVPDQASFS